MQRTPLRHLVFAACVLGMLSLGCGSGLPLVAEPEGTVVMGVSGLAPNADGVRGATLRGLTAKHWAVVGTEPGVIICSVNAGGHFATVRIEFDAQGYIILHEESSPALRFDGERIHRRYNSWIKNLQRAIQVELMRL